MKKIIIIFTSLLILFLAAACKTTPPVEDDPVEDTPEAVTIERPEAELNQARQLKEKVDKYELESYAAGEYASAEQMLQDGESNYEKDNATSKEALYKAIAKYKVVQEKGFPLLIDDKKQEIDVVKTDSEDLKAQVAVKDQYNEALVVYNEALSERDAGNYERSVELLAEANEKFNEVHKITLEKKERTENALSEFRNSLSNVTNPEEDQEDVDGNQDTDTNDTTDTVEDEVMDSGANTDTGDDADIPVTN